MKFNTKNICVFCLIFWFVPYVSAAENIQPGTSLPTNITEDQRAEWQSKMKVFKNYKSSLDNIGGNLADQSKDNPVYEEAGMYIIDIAVILGLLETVYTVTANCTQTQLTIGDAYKQILTALSYASNMIEYNQLKIDALYDKTKADDEFCLIHEGKKIMNDIQQTIKDEREDIFLKLKNIRKRSS